ncbi:YceD family protein [Riemerella columbina]|uniref:YceD family protein n=1 Tax=Riemerella columbina TaxID=103810 RepID=UPI00036B69CA|nr:DUF177 domain-containing protein [Riemerella columbina]
MEKFKAYEIVFSGLKNGKHHFEFEIEQSFFHLFGTDIELDHTKVLGTVVLDKHSTFMELVLSINGTVDLICDISGMPYTQPIENTIEVLIKFGSEYDDSDAEVITIPSSDHQFNVAQLIYEAITLAIPMKKVSPEAEENDEYEALLEQYSPKFEEEDEASSEEIDPRWAALQKLKNKN